MMSLYEFFFALSVLVLAATVSQRARYWTKMVTYFVIMQLISIFMVPLAAIIPKDPRSFLYGSRLFNWINIFFGIRWRVDGKENIKDKAYIIVANHQSSLDVLGMMINWEPFHPLVPVLKAELKYAFAFGLYCLLSGCVFIDRGTEQGRKALQEGLEEAKRMKKSMWIFPEGTRNHSGNGQLLPFKKGAFHMAIQAKIPILPVVFSGYSTFYSRKERRFDSGAVTITVLPEISTEGLTSANVTELCERTRNVMAEHFIKTVPIKSKCE